MSRLPPAQSLRQWKRRRLVACGAMMPAGLLMLLGGSALAWGTRPMLGFTLGTLGVFAIVLGAFAGRLAMAGPFPEGLA